MPDDIFDLKHLDREGLASLGHHLSQLCQETDDAVCRLRKVWEDNPEDPELELGKAMEELGAVRGLVGVKVFDQALGEVTPMAQMLHDAPKMASAIDVITKQLDDKEYDAATATMRTLREHRGW